MKSAFLIYTSLLLVEGALAWTLTGQAFLLAAVSAGLLLYGSLSHPAKPLAEGARLFTAAALAVAGPLQYQHALIPLLLCFIALPHFLAATQALAEHRQEAAAQGHPRMRTLIFTISFYTSMGLVFLLARGIEPALPRLLTSLLALLVLLASLAAWEASRIPRLRPAASAPAPARRRWLGPAALLALAGLLYAGPLPMAANLLCQLSPHWRMNPVEFKNKPPQPPPSPPAARPADTATRLGVDESSVTGEHRLPPRSNLQSSGDLRFYVKMATPAEAATLLQQGPVYLRSHTLNHFSDNKWTPQVSGGVWIEDADDGVADGKVTLQQAPATPALAHEVFAFNADGYTMPALPGLTEIALPRVYAIPGDVLQSSATGDIRYHAVSAPVLYQALANPALLETGRPGDPIHLKPADGEPGRQLPRLASSIFGPETLLADRISALHAHFKQHYSYSTVMENPKELGPLENFLFAERKGHCDFYATAAALLLRQVGIPTRIAYGFASRETDPATGMIVFRDRHAHAWTEVFLKDYGWTLCDFTPSENVGQPAPPDQPPPPSPAPDLKQFADAAKDATPPPPVKTKVEPPFFARFFSWFKQQPLVTAAMRYAPVALTGFALLALLARLWRRTPPDPAAAAAMARALLDQQPGYFREFLRLSAAAGHPKPDGRTPLEHYQALHHAGLPVPPLRPMIQYHCATRYEDAGRDPRQEKTFQTQLAAFGEAILPSAPART